LNFITGNYLKALNYVHEVKSNYWIVYYNGLINKKRIVNIVNGKINCSCAYTITFGLPCHYLITVFTKNNFNDLKLYQ